MPEPTTVWMVRLRKGELGERKGLLTLEAEGLVFRDESLELVRILRFDEVRRAKRVKGSPILLVSHADDDHGAKETAFYFTQPPPLTPGDPFAVTETAGSLGRPLNPLAAMRRTSKRRHMRDNVRYLTANVGQQETGDPGVGAGDHRPAGRLSATPRPARSRRTCDRAKTRTSRCPHAVRTTCRRCPCPHRHRGGSWSRADAR